MATQRIRVAARIRPLLPGDIDDEYLQVFSAADKSSSSTDSDTTCILAKNQGGDWSKFPFTSCYDASSTQEEIFQNDVQPLIDVIYRGITVTVFAYGVTSSGKTHTMQGSKEQPGIIPRTVRALFDKKSEMSESDISLSLSYMEIYKDEVYDLLVPRDTAQKLPVREDGAGVVFVANLTWKPISSVSEFDSIYSKASKQRSVGSTKLNNSSSRSHAILSLQVSMFDSVNNKIVTGKILLVDLAGSENNKLTGNDPSRMAESSAINRSLSVLGQVVRALNAGHTRIPYRDSKLTRILQPALGGDSLGLLICNLAPGTKLKKDTLNTLNFASTAVNIENKPTVHEASNAPQPKPHFAALNVYPRKSVVLQSAASNILNARPSVGSRPSLVPRFSRLSSVHNFQPFSFAPAVKENSNSASREGSSRGSTGLSEKEIDERISKAVEAEVERRLAEREKERQQEEEERRQREAAESSTSAHSLPSGVLTPLIKRHHDLDEELKGRLKDLEDKYLKEEKEVYGTGNLSPVSRKKAGRAYVALARTYSGKGELGNALELYRKAELYVPENLKLKERIIDIEYAVKNGTEFVPSPKKPKKGKAKQKKKKDKEPEQGIMSDEQMEVDEVARTLAHGPLEFDEEDSDVKMETPQRKRIRDEGDDVPSSKRRRGLDGTPVVADEDEEEKPRTRRSPRKRTLV